MFLVFLIIIYLSYACIGMPFCLPGAVWQSMYAGMAVPDSWLGIVSMIMMCCNIIGNTYSGKLLKYFKPGLIVTLCVFMIGAALFGIAIAGSFVFLCILAIPLGMGMGFIDAIVNNYVAVYFKAKHMSWLHCCWGLGAMASPAILSYGTGRYNSWRWGYYAMGVVQIAVTIILFLTLPLWKLASGTSEPVKETAVKKFRDLIRIKGLKASLTAFFCDCSVEMTVAVWGSSYLFVVKNISVEAAAQGLSMYYLGQTLGRLFSGFLTLRFSNHQLIRAGVVVFVIGALITVFSSGIVFLMGGFFLIGMGCAPFFPCLMHDTPNHFGKENSQSAVGLQLASANIGCVAAPPLFGLITAYIGYGMFPLYLGIWLTGMIMAAEALQRKQLHS